MRDKDQILLDIITLLDAVKQDLFPANSPEIKNENRKMLDDYIAEYKRAVNKK